MVRIDANSNRTTGVTANILIPFVAFMITDLFHYRVEDVGYYGGWLTSAYFLSQIVSSVVLGQYSDVKGRRIVMLTGMAGNLVTTIIFGFSRVFWLALLARFICGLINGNIGVIKSYIREITDHSNQARGYTLRSAGYSIGTIVGPLLGGALARPAIQYPSYFSSTGIFGRFPFLLPCLASALISLISLILGYFFLQETVVQPILDPDAYSSDEAEVNDSEPPTEPVTPSLSQTPSPVLSRHAVPPSNTSQSNNDVELDDLGEISPRHDDAVPLELENTPDPEKADLEPDVPRKSKFVSSRRKSWWSEFKAFGRQLSGRLGFFKKALGEHDVVLSILLYAGVAFVQLGFEEVFAFWAIRPVKQGGIAFSTLQIGTAQALSGISMLVMQIFAYVPMDRAFGTQNTLTIAMILLVPPFVAVSFASLVAASKALLWTLLSFVMFGKAGFGTIGFAAVNLLVSNAAGSETVGAVNGLSASVAAAARVLAPIVVGSIFAATANSTIGFPIDYHFAFFFLAAVSILIALGSHYTLPDSINRRKG